MSTDSKDLKVAQLLLNESTGSDNKIDADKVKEVLQELRNLPRSKSLPVLRHYQRLINIHERSYQCIIEKAHSDNNSAFSETLLTNLPQSNPNHTELVTSTNASLIAGFKLKLGDDVYEDAISSRLSRLKKSLP